MSLMEEIKFYIKDEEEANTTYSRMADDADDAGMHKTAQILRGMAADELRHKEMLEGMYYKPEFGPVREEPESVRRAREVLGRISRPLDIGALRPFPQTYGDWVNLAEDIKAKLPEIDWPIVNTNLSIISGDLPGDAEDAKRRLVLKARELGIT